MMNVFFRGDKVLYRKEKEIWTVIEQTRDGVVWCRKSWWWALFGAKMGFHTCEIEVL